MRSERTSLRGVKREAENDGPGAIDIGAASAAPVGAWAVTVAGVTFVTTSDTDCTPIRYVSDAFDAGNCRQKFAGTPSSTCFPCASVNGAPPGVNACDLGVLTLPATVTSTLTFCAG